MEMDSSPVWNDLTHRFSTSRSAGEEPAYGFDGHAPGEVSPSNPVRVVREVGMN
jgi:hypothetical protein